MRGQLRYLCSLDELRCESLAWDDLWYRSGTSAPVARAELIAQWIETFSPGVDLQALVVESEGQLVAALPLVGGSKAKLLRVGMLPRNDWSRCGDLLWDSSAGPEPLDLILRGLRRMPWSVMWLDRVAFDEPHWQEFLKALGRARLPWNLHTQARFGVVDCRADWTDLQAAWSKKHRHNMRGARRKAESEGELKLQVRQDFCSPEEVADLVRRGFEIEDRSWKGTIAGSSVLKSAGMLDFLTRQAQQLAQWGQLQLVFLELSGRPMAFEFGWCAKGVYFTPKIGYDETFSRFSPSQLLRYELFERFHEEQAVQFVDFAGEQTDATAKWCTGDYPVGRLVFGCGSLFSRAIMNGYDKFRHFRETCPTETVARNPRLPLPEPATTSSP